MRERANCGAQLKPSGTRKFCADIDVLRAEEWKRRRLLRLEQVRQQSKDIASDIRKKVYLEKNCLAENFKKRNEVASSRWKELKLTALQNELTATLSNVGSAHKQAECESKLQEAKIEVKNHHVEAADRRGREALLRLRSDELARQQAKEVKKLQQQHVQSVEGARTAVVVSLPVPKSTVPVGNVAHLPKTEVVKEKRLPESSTKQWPSKAWSVSVPLGVTPVNIEEPDSIKISNSIQSGVTSETKDDGLGGLPSNQENETSITALDRQERPDDDAPVKVSSSTHINHTLPVQITYETRKKNAPAPRTDKAPKEVELYDCANGSHVQYVKPSGVCKSIPAGPVDGLEAAAACTSISIQKKNLTRAMTAKRIERGKEAIKRVQTRREHQALLSELAGLVRQQAALRSFCPAESEPAKLQERLNGAVLDLLKEPPTVNVGRSVVSEAIPDKIPSESLETRSDTNETLIDVCSDEAMEPSSETPLKGNGTKQKITRATGIEQNISKQYQKIDLTLTRAESPATSMKENEGEFSLNDTKMSSSAGSDAPKLNLALWTSRSSGGSDGRDRTLTPPDVAKASEDSSRSTESGDKTWTSFEKQGKKKSIRRSSTTPSPISPTGPVTNEKITSGPGGKISSTERHSNQRSILTVQSSSKQPEAITGKGDLKTQKHLGSGDFVTPASVTRERKSCLSKQESSAVSPEGSATDFKREHKALPTSEERRRRKKESPSSSSSTSYMSLPNKLLSAITEDLRSLLSLTRRRKEVDGPSHSNPLLAHYINRLLDMSRQSVERLNVITSEVPTPPSAVFRNVSDDSSSQRNVGFPPTADPIGGETRNDLTRSSTDATKTSNLSSSAESTDLVNVMQQCYARISSLSQMIERVRQESVICTPVQNGMSPSFHLDSTAYLSPPSAVLPSSLVLPKNTQPADKNNPMDETYGAVINRLISEIRQQLVKEAEKPLLINLTPPRGSAKNMKSPSSNELSTIPEQDSSSVEWSSKIISSETCGSSEDVEREFSRMGLGWAGTTLRKTKEAYTLDSNSSSDFLELSTLSMFGSYSHSTPIKTVEEKRANT